MAARLGDARWSSRGPRGTDGPELVAQHRITVAIHHVVLRIPEVLLGLIVGRVFRSLGLRGPFPGQGPLLGRIGIARRICAFAAGDQTGTRHPTDQSKIFHGEMIAKSDPLEKRSL